ncbi:hypothetical protein LXL04_004730 [Taraxacum kok-saghyz]
MKVEQQIGVAGHELAGTGEGSCKARKDERSSDGDAVRSEGDRRRRSGTDVKEIGAGDRRSTWKTATTGRKKHRRVQHVDAGDVQRLSKSEAAMVRRLRPGPSDLPLIFLSVSRWL